MSRKTKKQKLAAEQRRRELLQTLPNLPTNPPFYDLRPHDVKDTLPKESPIRVNKYSLNLSDTGATTTLQNDYQDVLSDLKRILTLTVLAFCAQIVLWYFLGR